MSGGLGDLKYPLIFDVTKSISNSYDVLIHDQGIALRGLFIIDKEGILIDWSESSIRNQESACCLKLELFFEHWDVSGSGNAEQAKLLKTQKFAPELEHLMWVTIPKPPLPPLIIPSDSVCTLLLVSYTLESLFSGCIEILLSEENDGFDAGFWIESDLGERNRSADLKAAVTVSSVTLLRGARRRVDKLEPQFLAVSCEGKHRARTGVLGILGPVQKHIIEVSGTLELDEHCVIVGFQVVDITYVNKVTTAVVSCSVWNLEEQYEGWMLGVLQEEYWFEEFLNSPWGF
ncbi:hypothetical protein Drorol1_Dr00004647 [Drosera rotundifolia]